jgi:hypothetical protein
MGARDMDPTGAAPKGTVFGVVENSIFFPFFADEPLEKIAE